jgi:hypothetical protein
MNELFMRNDKDFRISYDLVEYFQQFKYYYDINKGIPFYNPIAMTYEIMTTNEYDMLLCYLYNEIRAKQAKGEGQ